MKNLFTDNFKANMPGRIKNILLLEQNGFVLGGVYAKSGDLYVKTFKRYARLTFGIKCNRGGKHNTKYFSLSRKFKSEEDAIIFYTFLSTQLDSMKPAPQP